MAFHPSPYTIEVVILGDHEGDTRKTTIHYRYPISAPPTDQNLIDVVNDIATRVVPRLAACCVASTRWTSVTATDINAANGRRATLALNPPITGTSAGDPLPGNVNLAIKKATGNAGRHTWGSLFIPDLSESSQSDSIVNSTLLGLVASLGSALLARTPATGLYPPVVASKKHVIFYLINAIVFNAALDSLYTRLLGKRRHRRRTATP